MRVAVIVLSLASTVCLVSLAFWQLADSEDLKPEPISEERIIVMQHFNTNDDRVHRLQNISRIQHEQYASFWGYGYHVSEQQFVPSIKPVRERQMNKLYALLALAIEQVGRGEYGAEWIYITDADVLIRNPAIPLHALLPMDPAALIVGTEDFNGFNSGNMLYRCGRDLIAFLSHAIALSYQIAREYDVAQDVGGGELFDIETPPTDQRALCLTLEQQSSFADRFFHYPSHWLNAYLPDLRDMQLNSHLVADDRYRADLDQFLISEREGWGRLEEMSTAEIIVTVESVKSQAEDYWKDAKTGLPHCIWV